MSSSHAKQLIVGAMVVSALLGVIRSLEHGDAPRARIAFGAFTAGALLLLLSQFQPRLAVGMAMIALISAGFTAGESLAAITRILKE